MDAHFGDRQVAYHHLMEARQVFITWLSMVQTFKLQTLPMERAPSHSVVAQ